MKRYTISTDIAFREWEDEDPEGEWVRYTDVKPLLDKARNALESVPDPSSYELGLIEELKDT